MSISDDLMLRYYELLTDLPMDEIKTMHPNEAKKKLASILVSRFYGDSAAAGAREEFEKRFKHKDISPEDFPLEEIPPDKWGGFVAPSDLLLVSTGMASSLSDARRTIKQKGFKIGGETLLDPAKEFDASKPLFIQRGKVKAKRVIKRK
jgi:tyrosyl-tRNA synthetase